jgi:hypothetical protein
VSGDSYKLNSRFRPHLLPRFPKQKAAAISIELRYEFCCYCRRDWYVQVYYRKPKSFFFGLEVSGSDVRLGGMMNSSGSVGSTGVSSPFALHVTNDGGKGLIETRGRRSITKKVKLWPPFYGGYRKRAGWTTSLGVPSFLSPLHR